MAKATDIMNVKIASNKELVNTLIEISADFDPADYKKCDKYEMVKAEILDRLNRLSKIEAIVEER